MTDAAMICSGFQAVRPAPSPIGRSQDAGSFPIGRDVKVEPPSFWRRSSGGPEGSAPTDRWLGGHGAGGRDLDGDADDLSRPVARRRGPGVGCGRPELPDYSVRWQLRARRRQEPV